MADSRNNETYTGDTLVKAPDVHGSYAVKAGTKHIMGMAFRKKEYLTEVMLPAGLLSIGDAAFSHCKALKEVAIPSTVETIGAATFCNTGLESVTFFGVPETIESSAFDNCENLDKVLIPSGMKSVFSQWFNPGILVDFFIAEQETGKNRDLFGNVIEIPVQLNLFAEPAEESQQVQTDLFGNKVVGRASLTYNCHNFSWTAGDDVSLSELFSGPTILRGNPSYQFRKKCLFIFMKSQLARSIQQIKEYFIPANTSYFKSKYKEMYGSRKVRVFLFVCDNGNDARFYDEVRVENVLDDMLQVKSVIK